MLNNREIAPYLIRGRKTDVDEWVVGTGIILSYNYAKIFDETHMANDKWINVDVGTIDKCIGTVDATGVPVFVNDIVRIPMAAYTIHITDEHLDTRNHIIRYGLYDMQKKLVMYINDPASAFKLIEEGTVIGHVLYPDTIKYTKKISLVPHDDHN